MLCYCAGHRWLHSVMQCACFCNVKPLWESFLILCKAPWNVLKCRLRRQRSRSQARGIPQGELFRLQEAPQQLWSRYQAQQ